MREHRASCASSASRWGRMPRSSSRSPTLRVSPRPPSQSTPTGRTGATRPGGTLATRASLRSARSRRCVPRPGIHGTSTPPPDCSLCGSSSHRATTRAPPGAAAHPNPNPNPNPYPNPNPNPNLTLTRSCLSTCTWTSNADSRPSGPNPHSNPNPSPSPHTYLLLTLFLALFFTLPLPQNPNPYPKQN